MSMCMLQALVDSLDSLYVTNIKYNETGWKEIERDLDTAENRLGWK